MANFVKLSDGRWINRDMVTHTDVYPCGDGVVAAFLLPFFNPTSGDQEAVTVDHETRSQAQSEISRFVHAAGARPVVPPAPKPRTTSLG